MEYEDTEYEYTIQDSDGNIIDHGSTDNPEFLKGIIERLQKGEILDIKWVE